MATRNFTIEQGLRIADEDGQNFVDFLQGAGVPGGDTGPQDDAPIGSLWAKTDGVGGLYKKVIDNNLPSDWEEVGNVSLDQLSWRSERVEAATNDTLVVGSTDPTAWTDNEQGLDGNDFVIGQYIIGDADGTPALFEITAITSATDITLAAASQPITANDTFIVQKFLPDSPANQENQAIVHSPDGTSLIKIADIDWALATGINLSSGYLSQNGTVAAGETVEVAIQKLDGNQKDLTTLSGAAQGAVDYGVVFTGVTIPDNSNNVQALQALENAVEAVQASGSATGVTALTVIDTVLVDLFEEVEWEVVFIEEASPVNKRYLKISGLHNGTPAADATIIDRDRFSRKRVGAFFNAQINLSLGGAGATQVMQLTAASTTAGITIKFRRNGVLV